MPTTPPQLLAQINGALGDPRVQEPLQRTLSFYFSNLGWLKALAMLLTAFFILATIFFIAKTGWLALRVDRVRDVVLKSNLPKKRSIKAWKHVKKHFFAGDDNSLKLAVVESDNLLDEALKLAGFRGPTLGDKLKALDEAQLPNIQDVWEAHKLRNRIVHESGFKLNRDTAERALAIYERTFRDLGILD